MADEWSMAALSLDAPTSFRYSILMLSSRIRPSEHMHQPLSALFSIQNRFPTKRLRLKLDGQQWVDGVPVHGSYFEFREGAPFRFPLEVRW